MRPLRGSRFALGRPDGFAEGASTLVPFRLSYLSCLPLGLKGQAGPVLVEPHQMHLLAPCPWRCLPVGENGHADPYDDEPHHSQCFSSSTCSCFIVGLWVQECP
ncbi:MAG: hypothetical protein IJH50_07415 [Kiritimatiellae bacterium]|nr:hypothetical protein [Kiritimatiellia bacterium]